MIRSQALERSSLAIASARQRLLIVAILALLLAVLAAAGWWASLALAAEGAEQLLLAPFRWGPGQGSAGIA